MDDTSISSDTLNSSSSINNNNKNNEEGGSKIQSPPTTPTSATPSSASTPAIIGGSASSSGSAGCGQLNQSFGIVSMIVDDDFDFIITDDDDNNNNNNNNNDDRYNFNQSQLLSSSSSSIIRPTFSNQRRSLNNNNNSNIQQRGSSRNDFSLMSNTLQSPPSSLSSSSSPFVQHEVIQKKAFTKWLNSHLTKKGYPLINDLFTDLRDGTILIALIDVLCGCKIKSERGKLRVHQINNIARALQVLNEKCQIKLVNISTNDIVDGNHKITLGLIWCIILHWQVNNILFRNTTTTANSLTTNSSTIAGHQHQQQSNNIFDQQQSIPVAIINEQHHRTPSSSSTTTSQFEIHQNQQQPHFPYHQSNIPQVSITITGTNQTENNPSSSSKWTSPSSLIFSGIQSESSIPTARKTFVSNPSGGTSGISNSSPKPNNSSGIGNNQQQQQHHLATMSQNDLEKTLLAWCRSVTHNYEGVEINNFTTSWGDGLAFNALMHHFRPKLFSYGEILSLDPEDRLRHAFDLASKYLGIEKLLDPEDVNTPRPDKKSVMMYVMCFFEVFQQQQQQQQQQQSSSEGTKSNFPKRSASMRGGKTSLRGGEPPFKRQTRKTSSMRSTSNVQKSSNIALGSNEPIRNVLRNSRQKSSNNYDQSRPSFIPVLSSKFSTNSSSQPQQQQQASSIPKDTSSSSSSSLSYDSSIDTKLLLEEYSNDIEDLMTWLLGAEDDLKTKEKTDHERFNETNFESLDDDSIILAQMASDSENSNKFLHDRITSTIEAAEYAKHRFTEHEQFMIEMTKYSEKIHKAFEKGKMLIDVCSKTNSSSSSVSDDNRSKVEVAIRMNLLNQRFSELRSYAIKHQKYLQDMLIAAQNNQLAQLRVLMTTTEQRISILLPEKFDEIPFSFSSLREQLEQFKRLQESMNSKQELLSCISKFMIVEQEDQKDGANFVDQLEALNERWANVCKITENRGRFLNKLYEAWSTFDEEKNRLNEWFQRLERRLNDIEESVEETIEPNKSKQDYKFLKNISVRLDRMRSDILYGPEKSQMLHRKIQPMSDDGDENEVDTSPISKITRYSHALIKLDSKGNSKLSQKVIQNIEEIGRRWETLAGQIESIENCVRNRLAQFPYSIVEEVTKEESAAKQESSHNQKIFVSTKTSQVSNVDPFNKENEEWKNDAISMIKWVEDQIKGVRFLSKVFYNSDDDLNFNNEQERSILKLNPTINIETYRDLVEDLDEQELFNSSKKPKVVIPVLDKFIKNHPDYFDTKEMLNSNKSLTFQKSDELFKIHEEVVKNRDEIEDLISQGRTIVDRLKSEHEKFDSIDELVQNLNESWAMLQSRLEKINLYIEIASYLESMYDESRKICQKLYDYRKKFEFFENELLMHEDDIQSGNIIDGEECNKIIQDLEVGANYIRQQFDKVDDYNDKLCHFHSQLPQLFVCWPEKSDNSSAENIERWIWYESTNIMKFNAKHQQCKQFQLRCFYLSSEMFRFNRTVNVLSQLSTILKDFFVDLSSFENENKKTSEKSKKSFEIEVYGSNIDEFNEWLDEVILVVDEVKFDEDEESPIIHKQGMKEKQKFKKLKLKDKDQSIRHQKTPGSNLDTFSDLANAIDRRIQILETLQYNIHERKKLYLSFCKTAAEIIFERKYPKGTDLEDIEQSLMSLNASDYDKGTSQLVSQIQSLIQKWKLLQEKVIILLPQLEDIAPSITVLETEFSQLLKFVESSDRFLDEPIAIGDNESLTCQLAECKRLKEYMQGSAEENFQTIINTAQKALKLLFGDDVFYDVIPVVKYIKETWLNLCKRILNKLDRLEYAQKMTINLMNQLDDYQQKLSDIENRLKPKSLEDKLKRRSLGKSVTIQGNEYYNGISKQLNELKSTYEKIITGTETGVVHEMVTFTSNPTNRCNTTLAFEHLKEMAMNKIPEKFQLLQQKLNDCSKTFQSMTESYTKLEQLLQLEHELNSSKMSDYGTLQSKQYIVQDLEDAAQLLDEVENCLTKFHEPTRQNRLKNIEQIISKQKEQLTNQFSDISSLNDLLQKYKDQFKDTKNFEKEISSKLRKLKETLEKFISDCKEADQHICMIQKWLTEFKAKMDTKKLSETDSYSQLEAKRKELITIKNLYLSKFEVLGFIEASNRMESKAKFVQKTIDELVKRNSQQSKITSGPARSLQLQTSDFIKRNKNHSITSSSKYANQIIDIDSELTTIERELADLGSMINEIEIQLDGPDKENQNISTILKRLAENVGTDYGNQLSSLKKQMDNLKNLLRIKPEMTLTPIQQSRIESLEKTQTALIKSLQFRMSVLNDTVSLCENINTKLLQLEDEGSKIKMDDQQQTPTDDEQIIKQNCRAILGEICELKEQLDISCIQHSDILIGIEEVGAFYDELITMIAELYSLDDVEDDADFEADEMPQSNHVENNDDRTISFDDPKTIVETSIRKSIIEPESIKPIEKGLPIQESALIKAKPDVKISDFLMESEDNYDVVNEEDEQQPISNDLVSKLSPSLIPGQENFDKYNSYSFHSFLVSLKLLENQIDRIAQRQIPEFTKRRQFKENNMFPFMLEDELYVLNKSLNESRIQLEQILCAAMISGLKKQSSSLAAETSSLPSTCPTHGSFSIASDTNQFYDQVKILALNTGMVNLNNLTDDWRPDVKRRTSEWDGCYCQTLQLLERLEAKFNRSNGIFLSLHRHLKLIHEDTIQFNLEIRRLCDWFENVELQINNGRVTLVSADPNRLDETDLNLHVVARTQSLLVTQLKTHMPVYGRLNVIYERILKHFSPELDQNFRDYSFDFKSLVEAKDRIKHEMDRVTRKWNSIVHELTWRRQCLIDLATCKPTATVNGLPYRPGHDQDFDILVRDSVRIDFEQLSEIEEIFPLHHLRKWIKNTEQELKLIRQKYTLSDSITEGTINLHKKLRDMEQEMAKQFMNWMIMTQEPFVRHLKIGNLNDNEREQLSKQFQKVCGQLYSLSYFVDAFLSSCSNIAILIRNELEWLLISHEHLITIDEYLGATSPLAHSLILAMDQKSKQKLSDQTLEQNQNSSIVDFPIDSFNFMENIRNTLINHERSIKQIAILFDELQKNSDEISFKCEIQKLTSPFNYLKILHKNLIENLRRYGLTLWSSVHYLNRNVFSYLYSYRQKKAKQKSISQSTSTTTTTNNSIGRLKQTDSERSRLHQHMTHSSQIWECNSDELWLYYQLTKVELNRWISFEMHFLSLFIEKTFQEPSETVHFTSSHFPYNNHTLHPSKILKFTIRRCEDFLTELNFSVTILKQIWLQLSFENRQSSENVRHQNINDNQRTETPIVGHISTVPTTNANAKYSNKSTAIKSNASSLSKSDHLKYFNQRAQSLTNNGEHETQSITATNNDYYHRDEHCHRDGHRHHHHHHQNDEDDFISNSKRFNSLDPRRSSSSKKTSKSKSFSNQNGDSFSPQNHRPVLAPDFEYYQKIQTEIMERVRDMQREHHQRSLQQLIAQMKSQFGSTAGNQQQQQQDNVYDTVADAFSGDNSGAGVADHNDTYHQSSIHYHRPPDLPEMNNSNLDMQKKDIESWLESMEQRLSRITVSNNGIADRTSVKQSNHHNQDNQAGVIEEQDLKNQLEILSEYENECNQYSVRLQMLSNSIDARLASLAPLKQTLNQNVDASLTNNSSDNNKSSKHQSNNQQQPNISMPYYDHLVKLRKQASDMQCRSNYLFLCIKCKTRSLNELLSITSSSSQRNLIMSMVNSSVSGTDLDFYGTQSSKKSSKSNISSTNQIPNSNNKSQDISASGSISATTGNVGSSSVTSGISGGHYGLHEQSEKRFSKWLTEMEQSLDFIEKGLSAESALINPDGTITNFNCDDGALYSNVSEMQQMYMNYYEKIKIIQREIEQKRADHRLLMELLESGELNQNDSKESSSSSPYRRTDANKGRSNVDPWFARFRSRVERMNMRWNSVRLRVLTLRSRLESSSLVNKNTTTTCPIPATHSLSLYSVNAGLTVPGGADAETASLVSASINSVAYVAVVSERASQLILSLRELSEWIIKRQTEFEQKQQFCVQSEGGSNQQNVPLDITNVIQQKSSLIQLRNQLIEKRPIIDSSLLSCHNFLRRLDSKRIQDVKLNAKLSASASMASSLAGSIIGGDGSQQTESQRLLKQQQKQSSELEKIELSLNREMNKILELWHSIQNTVDMGLQRLDEAHLRLNDLQRVMDDLGAKLHEAEMVKTKWTPISNITFDELPQHRSQLKTFQQMYVAPVSRDVIHVNEIAARLTGRNVPLSHANLKSLEDVTTRARLLRIAVDERARELDQVVHDHGSAQQHFLTEAVEEPWERAVTNNKLPCYINRKTETVHSLSPRYTGIIQSLIEFNDVRYAAYRTALKLRHLQIKFGLDLVTLDNLMNAFEQHGLGPNATNQKAKSQNETSQTNNSTNDKSQTDTKPSTDSDSSGGIKEDLPYELRLIGVPDIVSCLKMIFEQVESERQQQLQQEKNDSSGKSGRKSSKSDSKSSKPPLPSHAGEQNASSTTAPINVPLFVDLCLNWLLDLYDAPSRAGFIRQFSFQVALVLLSRISLEQKYLYLFNLIANENQRADERRFGLLIYDCLRLPKLLGEVAAFGGTNVEPSVRTCLEMADFPTDGLTAQHVLNWVRAEPQSLVWLVVMHRLRLAERSRHPAKCNACRCYPIVGFRYRCLKCFNFDLCQYCFLSDKTVKKHKPSHPMQEYCVATTSSEDMKDFTKILRNKFKSGRYFKQHQALGYLPVQSLHEGDRIEESAPTFVHTLQGSYSHAPSSNTTPVHTLSYPQRAASPGSLTQRDMDFVLDSSAGSSHHRIPGNPLPPTPMQQSVHDSPGSGIYGTRSIQQGRKFQTSVEHHLQHRQGGPNASPLLNQRDVGPSNPSRASLMRNISSDEMHQRIGHYVSRLADAEMRKNINNSETSQLNRSESLHYYYGPRHSSTPQPRATRFDSLQPQSSQHPHQISPRRSSLNPRSYNPPHDDKNRHIVQSPTEMLSKIAADQRNELEIIIQRLQEENRLLINEYSQLKNDKKSKTKQQNVAANNDGEDKKLKSPPALKPSEIKNFNSEKSTPSTTSQRPTQLIQNQRSSSSSNNASIESTTTTSGGGKSSSNDHASRPPTLNNTTSSMTSPNSDETNTTTNTNTTTTTTTTSQSQKQTDTDDNDMNGSTANNTTTTTAKEEEAAATRDSMPPKFWLEEARRLKNDKNRLESRASELEKCNRLLETQLNQFKQYINTTGGLDLETKQKLGKRIEEAQKLLDQQQIEYSLEHPQTQNITNNNWNKSTMVTNNRILKFDNDEDNNSRNDSEIFTNNGQMNNNSGKWKQSKPTTNPNGNSQIKSSNLTTSLQHQPTQPLLHTAADHVNNAIGSLVNAFENVSNDDDLDENGGDNNDDVNNEEFLNNSTSINGQSKPSKKTQVTGNVSHV